MRVHMTENRSVGGSIPPLGTSKISLLAVISDFEKCACPHSVRINVVGHGRGCCRPVKALHPPSFIACRYAE